MPTYEYACRECDHHFEVVQSFRDDALTVCPNCQGHLRKVFSAAGIIFKGSGYYVNDSRAASTPSGTSSDKADGKAAASKADSDSPSTSADKADKGEKGEKSTKKPTDSDSSAPASKSA